MASSTTLVTVTAADIDLFGGTDTTDTVLGFLLAQRSANTRKAYRGDLRSFTQWLADTTGLGLLDADRAHIDAYARWSTELEGRRPSTVARRLATLASFYAYAIDTGATDRNPADGIRRPSTSEEHVALTPAIDTADARGLVATAAAHGTRDHLLVLLLSVCGLRVSEALSIDLDHIEWVRGHCSAVVRGKGGTEHRVTFPASVCDLLDQIATVGQRTTGPLLLANDGENRMNPDQAARAIARLGNRAGIDRKVTPHMLRATAITEALEASIPLRDVQDFARHADPRTTRRYDRARAGLDRNAATTAAIAARIGQ